MTCILGDVCAFHAVHWPFCEFLHNCSGCLLEILNTEWHLQRQGILVLIVLLQQGIFAPSLSAQSKERNRWFWGPKTEHQNAQSCQTAHRLHMHAWFALTHKPEKQILLYSECWALCGRHVWLFPLAMQTELEAVSSP